MSTGRGDDRFDVSWFGAAGENPVDLAIADLDEEGRSTSRVCTDDAAYVVAAQEEGPATVTILRLDGSVEIPAAISGAEYSPEEHTAQNGPRSSTAAATIGPRRVP